MDEARLRRSQEEDLNATEVVLEGDSGGARDRELSGREAAQALCLSCGLGQKKNISICGLLALCGWRAG
jgi:hypothetical protein